MGLYINRSLNKCAFISNIESDGVSLDTFNKNEEKLQELAKGFGLYISSENLNDDCDKVIAIHNSKPSWERIYGGEVFGIELDIPDDDTFEDRFSQLIDIFKSTPSLKVFGSLTYSESGKRLFVIS